MDKIVSSYILENKASWDTYSADYQQSHGAMLTSTAEAWGVWRIPESQLNILGDVKDKDVLEFGCGAAQWAIALARRGARMTGIDISSEQLRFAREAQQNEDVDFPLIECSATEVPLPDSSFDLIFCDHGATSFTDPKESIPEAARLLRSGGILAFCISGPIREICYENVSDKVVGHLTEPYFGMERYTSECWTSFNLTYGEWIALFRSCGLAIERLEELQPDEQSATTYEGFVSLEWARKWPAEIIWVVRKE